MIAPVVFMLPAWGASGVRRFTEIALPTLLAPGNLPAVDRPAVFLVWTRREDWDSFAARPSVQTAQRYAEFRPIFFEPSPLPESRHVTMSRGHRAMLGVAERERAVTVPVFADSVFADGGLAALLAMTRPGRRMVMTLGLRIGEEAACEAFGFGKRTAVSIKPRELAGACAGDLMHSQIRCWSAEEPAYGDDVLGGPWWRAAPDGIVTHSIYWEPTLIDFSFPWPHDASPVLDWTIDGHYSWWNLTRPEQYHVVTDSDEFLHVTTTSEKEFGFPRRPMSGTIAEIWRRAREHPTTDPLRQALCSARVYVHGSDIGGGGWREAEAKADAVLEESAVPTRERWALRNRAFGSHVAGIGKDRAVVVVEGTTVISVPRDALKSMDFGQGGHFAPGVQPHQNVEDALVACGIAEAEPEPEPIPAPTARLVVDQRRGRHYQSGLIK